MDTDLLRKLLNENRELSALPHTLAEVLRVARDEQASAEQVAGVLMRDQAMTANVLRIVNSPFYGVGRNIGNVTQAVMTIGMWQVTALALSTSVYQMTDNWRSTLDRVRFWRHSLEVAIAARMIAKKIKYRQVEDAYVAGMLHDLGILVLENSFPDQFEAIWQQERSTNEVLAMEDGAWGTNHARVGQFLLQHWFLPEGICEAVGKHHSQVAPDSRQAGGTVAQIVRLAHIVSKFTLVSDESADPKRQVTREVLRAHLGLSEEDLLEIERSLFQETIDEAAYLEIEIGTADSIMREANELLFNQYVTVGNLLKEIGKMKQQIAQSQNEKAAWQSLQASTMLLAKHLKSAASIVRQQTDALMSTLDNTPLLDEAMKNIRIILTRTETVESIADGLTGLGEMDEFGKSESEWVAELEDRIARKQESLRQSTPLA